MQFTIEYLEYILLVFIRIASMMVTAPFFNSGNFPRMTKMGLSFFFSLVAVNLLDFNGLTYQGIAGCGIDPSGGDYRGDHRSGIGILSVYSELFR